MENETSVEQSPYPPESLSHGNFVKARCFFALKLWHNLHDNERINARMLAAISGVRQSSIYVLTKRWYNWKYLVLFGDSPGRPGPRNFTYELAGRGLDYWHDMSKWYPYKQAAVEHVLKASELTVWWHWRKGICYLTYPFAKAEDCHFTTQQAEMEKVLGGLMSHLVENYRLAMFFLTMTAEHDLGAELIAFLKQTQGKELAEQQQKEQRQFGRTPGRKPQTQAEWDAWAKQFLSEHNG